MMPKKSPTTHVARTAQMPPKKVYTREFKLETLRLLKCSGKTKADLERELGLYAGQIYLWEKAFNRKGKTWNKPSQAQDTKVTQKLNYTS